MDRQVFVPGLNVVNGEADSYAALDAAPAQMCGRGHAERSRCHGGPAQFVGVACRREARNLLKIRAEPA